MLKTPFAEISETNIRARVQKSVGRPADIYSPGSIGALFYYLVSGAYGNPKALCDALHKTGRRGLLGSRGAMAGGAVRKLYDDALSALGLRRKP